VPRWNRFTLARYACLLVACSALAGSAWFLVSRTVFWIGAESAVGTVIGWEQMKNTSNTGRRLQSGHAYAAAVTFVAADGEEHQFVADWGSESRPYERGEQVTVLYDPDEPGRVMIRGFVAMYLGPLLLLPMAAAFWVVALLLEFLGDSDKKRRGDAN